MFVNFKLTFPKIKDKIAKKPSHGSDYPVCILHIALLSILDH